MKTGSNFILVFALPPFISRGLTRLDYGTWALVVEITGYLTLLESGVTSATARQVAQSSEECAATARGRVGTKLSLQIGALTALIVVAIAAGAPHLIRLQSTFSFRGLLGALAAVSLWTIASSGIIGYFLGRNEMMLVGMTVAASRLAGGACVVVATTRHASLVVIGLAWAIPSVAGLTFLWVCFYQRPAGALGDLARRQLTSDMRKYCRSFSIWAVSGFLVVGLDTTLVGHFALKDVGPYAVACGLPLLMQAVAGSALAPFIPWVASRLHSRSNVMVANTIIRLTWWCSVGMGVVGFLFIALASPYVRLMANVTGQRYTDLVVVLVSASAVRLTLLPFATAVMAGGDHTLAVWVPLVEAASNLAGSVLLGFELGPLGVALGTLIGAVAGLIANYVFVFPRVRSLTPPTRASMGRVSSTVAILLVPIVVGRAYVLTLIRGSSGAFLVVCVSALISAILFWIANRGGQVAMMWSSRGAVSTPGWNWRR